MIDDRSRGIVLYSLTAAVLLAGGFWYFQADPSPDSGPEVAAWRATVERALPDRPPPGQAETVVLPAGARTERSSSVNGGPYTLSMVCAGSGGQVRVRMSTNGPDSGRAVPCTGEPEVDRIQVALVDELFLRLSVEGGSASRSASRDDSASVGGSVVFRWRLEPSRGF